MLHKKVVSESELESKPRVVILLGGFSRWRSECYEQPDMIHKGAEGAETIQ